MQKAEFDRFADEYYAQHERAIAISGESPDFFYEYKVAAAAREARAASLTPARILDFGSGVGNSVPYFRQYFPESRLTCIDVSPRSLAISEQRFPGMATHVQLEEGLLPFQDGAFDLAFTACVFHHIPHEQHARWLAELRRVCRPGALLFVFEHNPWNPLTAKIVRDCPFDENAVLLPAPSLRAELLAVGWNDIAIHFTVFFPRALAALRPFERWLRRLPLGAQYFAMARAGD